ncbi:TPA: hypothetical protein LA462_001155 [Clostridium botulinum]|nr:hypothetical protein [Clostridium botulinum]
MADKPKIFEKFYFTIDNKEHFTHEVQKVYEIKEGDISYYQGKMYCPECVQAELSFTHKTSRAREYLSKIPTSNHSIGCSYNYPYASKKTIYDYIYTLSEQQRRDRLESILNMLMKNNNDGLEKGIISSKVEENPLLVPKRDKKKTNIFNAIRRKSLNTWIDESDGTGVYIFYGKVKLETERKISKKPREDGTYPEYYLLKLYTKNKNGEYKFRTTIFRGKYKDEIVSEQLYNIAVIGYLDFSYKYMEIKIDYKDAVLYRVCNE